MVTASGRAAELACALMKIANDIRWDGFRPAVRARRAAAAGERARLVDHARQGEPDQSEALTMVCCQVMGNDVAVASPGRKGISS